MQYTCRSQYKSNITNAHISPKHVEKMWCYEMKSRRKAWNSHVSPVSGSFTVPSRLAAISSRAFRAVSCGRYKPDVITIVPLWSRLDHC